MGDHRDVAGGDLDGGGAHAAGEHALGIGRQRLVVGGDQVQDGSVFQAGTPITSPKAEVASGCCTAYITVALTGSTSAAKWRTKSSSDSQLKPRVSVNR